ncbi:MAG: T9SS type A sorting domain-containing protein [Fimbriimonadaceae bacterium]|nr:T9SS type A sorting domain-containing protein [Chitinophagales bacterium]
MKTKLLLACILTITLITAKAQWNSYQYFDGADTNYTYDSFEIFLDDDTNNIWQIGKPQKMLFDSAATFPNAIITDTINDYLTNNTSSFIIPISHFDWSWGVFAIQWSQKLDLEKKEDGAIIEFLVDSIEGWQNVFNNPYVYNFYGFDENNRDTLNSGEYAFSGTDSVWRDIWLCFEYSFIEIYDTVYFRYTFKSDSIENNKEGWMMDNFMGHITFIHTVKNDEQTEYLHIYPSPTDGIVHIEAEKLQEYHIIESIQLININGEIIKRYGRSPTKFYIDISDQENGLYYLRVNTNIKSETVPVLLFKN